VLKEKVERKKEKVVEVAEMGSVILGVNLGNCLS